MPLRSLPTDLQRDLNAAQSMLDALVRKARAEGYETEIHTRADDNEFLYAVSLNRRFTAAHEPPPTLRTIK